LKVYEFEGLRILHPIPHSH